MRQQGRSEQQVKPQRSADKLGQIGRDGRNLGRDPQEDRHRPGEVFAAVLRQRQARNDAQLRRQVLDEDGHRIRPKQHPQQPVPKAASTLDIGGKVAWIDIRDRRHKRFYREVAPNLVAPERRNMPPRSRLSFRSTTAADPVFQQPPSLLLSF